MSDMEFSNALEIYLSRHYAVQTCADYPIVLGSFYVINQQGVGDLETLLVVGTLPDKSKVLIAYNEAKLWMDHDAFIDMVSHFYVALLSPDIVPFWYSLAFGPSFFCEFAKQAIKAYSRMKFNGDMPYSTGEVDNKVGSIIF